MTEPVRSSLLNCRDLIQSIVAAVDARDAYTAHHSDRVAAMAVVLAKALHLSAEDTATVQIAALAHNIGRISMPDAVLRKAGPLTDTEWEEMRRCPVTGYDILRKVPQFQRVALIVRHCHERWDGRGYPDKLAGAAIPLGACIIAVADSIDAMMSNRSYRPAMTGPVCLHEIEKNRGVMYDPQVGNTAHALLRPSAIGAHPPGPRLPAGKPGQPHHAGRVSRAVPPVPKLAEDLL